ncbi:ATPase AAA [Bacteroidia bacterium]|nr:ATPase AAA [Bacteroidia bacterium]
MHSNIPLAERLRPQSLDTYIGQEHLVGKGAILRTMIESGNISSFILWGPPGVGKTTLAKIIAHQHQRQFYALSAVNAGVKEVREVIEEAKKQHLFKPESPILFIDEIHRFSKSQQDSLLGAVEQGIVTLVGATTENPSFEVISPLLSRCQVYVLKSLEVGDLQKLLQYAVSTDEYLKTFRFDIQETQALFRFSGGDARKLLNILDIVVSATKGNKVLITNAIVSERLQSSIALYDKSGEQHYDIISAFIKSMRGSEPNAAVYWLARMIEGGEDPLFIARRMLILASEDVGLANPNALLLAQACFDAVKVIGMPESRIILAQCAVYLATSPKSNASYMAIEGALAHVKEHGDLPVPLHLRNAPTKLMKDLGYHKGYKYAHDYEDNFVDMQYLPDQAKDAVFYTPGNNPKENEIRTRLATLWGKTAHGIG